MPAPLSFDLRLRFRRYIEDGLSGREAARQLKNLQEAYGEAMLELRARKKLAALMEREDDK